MRIPGLFVLAAQIYFTLVPTEFSGTVAPNATIYVKSCVKRETDGVVEKDFAFAALFADEKMKVPLANPMIADSDGKYRFYMYYPYFTLEAVSLEGKHTLFRNCQVNSSLKHKAMIP